MRYKVGLGLGNCRLMIPGQRRSMESGKMVDRGLVRLEFIQSFIPCAGLALPAVQGQMR